MDCPIGRLLDTNGELWRWVFDALEDFVEPCIAFEPQRNLEASNCFHTVPQVHVLEHTPKLGIVKPEYPYSFSEHSADHRGMDVWPQRDAFRVALERYMEREGKTQQDVADILEVSRDHLRNCLYRKGKRLGIDVIQKAAALFGSQTREFIDDPGSPIPGIEDQPTARLSVAKRAAMLRMYQNLNHSDVSDEDALKAIDIIETLWKKGIIRKPDF